MANRPQGEGPGNAQVNLESAADQASREHLLYVDDDASLVYLVTCILERLSYRVTGCTDPMEALKIFRSNPKAFDAVVSDFLMPGICGTEFAIKLLSIRPDIPILMVSGVIRPEEAAAVRSLGLPDLVLKPYAVDQFGKLIDDLFSRERLRRDPHSKAKTAIQS
jgi:DNA-binding NtrC family response regulator